MINNQPVIQFNSRDKSRYVSDAYLINFKENSRVITLRNGKKKTVYDKDKNTIILRPATIMASSVNEVSGKIIMLNAETE